MSAQPKTDSAVIRPMRDEDIAAVQDIERRAYDFPWSASIFSDCLRVGYCCWVLDTGDGLAGYGIMSVAVEESHILNVCVAPEARRQGHARARRDQSLPRRLMRSRSTYQNRVAMVENSMRAPATW